MNIYYAPMEGITNYVYRSAFHQEFEGVDKFFAPFIVTKFDQPVTQKDLKDVLPERNEGVNLIPQIMSNKGQDFLRMAEALEAIGYKEINFNLGCPSRTVVTKRRGSGFLVDIEELDRFFDTVFQKNTLDISVKTRLGIEKPEEIADLMKVYNRYPIKELIVHPRVQLDYYKNTPNLEWFSYAQNVSTNPICYNGDIFTLKEYRGWVSQFPQLQSVMLGRGLLRNPCLAEEIRGMGVLTKERLYDFHNTMYERYQNVLSGDKTVLFKMKELWFYWEANFIDAEKEVKKIRKTEKLYTYEQMVEKIFAQCQLVTPT